MANITVLGCGMVGSCISADLSMIHDVTVVDFNQQNLDTLSGKYKVTTIQKDLSDLSNVKDVIKDSDLVVCAVPGFMGFNTVKAIIESGKNVVDISFFPEDSFLLDELAKKNNVTAIVDCGVAPGMSNMVIGYHHNRMVVNNYKCYVGGLPVYRDYPFEYKAPFSPVDVLEEYTRPARYIENGNILIKPALSDPELLNFPEIGTLEAFNSDGLRSLLFTINCPNMIEKTMRYPGHINYIRAMKEAGFFSNDAIEISGTKIRPMEFTSKILFDKWKLKDSDDEFTIMRMIVEGIENNQKVCYTYDLLDRKDKVSGFSSMSRTTGYACTAAVNLFTNKLFSRKGICPPEFIAEEDGCFDEMLRYMQDRGVIYKLSKTVE